MKILDILKRIWFMFGLPISVTTIGIIVGIITDNGYAGFWTIGALIILAFLYGVYKSIEDNRRLNNEKAENKEE